MNFFFKKPFRLQIAWNWWVTHKKIYVAFFPWWFQHIFFSVTKAFLKEYPVILLLLPEVWTEEMKLFALHIYSTKLWFIHSFPFWPGSGPGKNMRIRSDPDPKHWLDTSSQIRQNGISPLIWVPFSHLENKHEYNKYFLLHVTSIMYCFLFLV